MKKTYKRAALVAAVVALAGAYVAVRPALAEDGPGPGPGPEPASASESTSAAGAVRFDPALVARGEYLARAGDCMACHTARKAAPGAAHGGAGHAAGLAEPFAGGLPIASPMGVIYASNITPDPTHGIGRYTEQQFSDAVRRGVRRDGGHLYPAMPYPDYARTSDADIHALYAYFMQGVKPVAVAAPQTALSFPFNQRWGMALWNAMFTSDKPFTPMAQAPELLNRGKYLVETLGHCGSCHTPRGVGMQQKSLSDESASFLSGGELNGWPVPSLRGMPGWRDKDITDYLETGRNAFASVAGEMSDVVAHSTQHLQAQDLQAIAAYLRSLPVDAAKASLHRRADAQAATEQTTKLLIAGRSLNEGQLLYLNTCEACHWTNGNGAPGIFPRLNSGSVVVADNPTGLITVILKGAQTPSTQKAPSILAMPGFEHRLTDQEVASLATFLRGAWGNDAPAVSESAVADVRKQLHKAEAM